MASPQINWNNEVTSLYPFALPEPSEPLPKTLAEKVHGACLHPYGVIDYHLYLAYIERGRDALTRQNEVMVVEEDGFSQYPFEDLLETDPSHPILFLNMPFLPLSTNSPLTKEKLVLGFDLKRQHLLGYFFESGPDDLADIWYVWHERQLVIDLPIDRFLDIYQYGVEQDRQCADAPSTSTTSTTSPTIILDTGIFRFFRESKRELPSGMDLVVTIQFAQFLQDFQPLWRAKSDTKVRIQPEDEEHCRTQLCQVSVASWFGARDGMSRETFREKIGQRVGGLLLDHPRAPVPSISPRKISVLSRLIVISEQLEQSQIHQFLVACLFFFTLISYE